MMPVRVLQVIDRLNYNSGVSSVLMNYYNHINYQKVIFDFLTWNEVSEPLKSQIEAKGSYIYYISSISFRNILTIGREAEIFFEQHREYKVVHIHTPNTAFIYARAAQKAGVPVRILHSHNAKGADGIIKKARNLLLNKWGIRYVNQYQACSRKAAVYLFGKRKVEKEEVVILNNAIDLQQFAFNQEIRNQIRTELQLNDKFIIGHVGRFCQQKNHEFLIDIFSVFHSKNPNSILMLLGEGEMKKQIKNKVLSLGLLDSVLFLGVKKEVYVYMQAMDVFVLPSLYEGLPVVCIEAQAAGLPCIISNRVTEEIKILKNTCFLDLKIPIEIWVGKLEEYKKDNKRIESNEIIKVMTECGYNIEKEAVKVENRYLEEIKGRIGRWQ